MSELYPTKTRLALLRDVAGGWVYRALNGHDYVLASDGRPQMVNVAVVDQEQSGWVELSDRNGAGISHWRLTDAGRAVLDAHGGER